MLIRTNKADLGKPESSGVLDQTIDALLSLPQYSQYKKEEVLDYLDKVSYHESRGQNVKQKGGGPATGYYQIEQNSLPFAIEGLQMLSKRSGKPIMNVTGKSAMELNKDEQAALTLVHGFRQGISHKTDMNFRDAKNTWLDTHWVGKRDNSYMEQRKKHAESWDRAMNEKDGKNSSRFYNKDGYKPESDNTAMIRPASGIALLNQNKVITNPDYGKFSGVLVKN